MMIIAGWKKGIQTLGNLDHAVPIQYGKKRAGALLEITNLFMEIIVAAADLIEVFRDLPFKVQIGLEFAAMPSVINGIYSVKKAVENVLTIFSKSKRPFERFDASCQLIMRLNSVVEAISAALRFFYKIGAAGVRVIQWIPIFNIVSYLVGYISFGLAAFSVYKSRKLLNSFEEIGKRFERAVSDKERAKILIEAVDVIEKEGIDPLRKELRLSKEAKKTLLDRIDLIRKVALGQKVEVKSEAQVIADMHEAYLILKDRIKIQRSFSVANVICEVSQIVGQTFTMIPPMAPVGYGVLMTSGVCSFVSYVGRTYFVSKNPFDPEVKSKAIQLLTDIQRKIRHLRRPAHVSQAAQNRLQSYLQEKNMK